MNIRSQNFSGYVLAGGKSSRMGTDKALLEFAGITFLERAAEVLAAICPSRVKILVNQTQAAKFETRCPGFEYVVDILTARGALGGIHAALRDCETEYAVILAVDLPYVPAAVLEQLARLISSENIAAVVPRQGDGKWQPLAAVYRVEDCLNPLEKLLEESGSASARDFLERIPVRFVDQKNLSEDDNLFFNVNRPADFAAVE